MPDLQTAVQGLQSGADVLFLLTGAILVFAMHGGFAFLEAGTVRHKNQVNALCKILVDFAISTIAYFFVGYTIAYGVTFFVNAESLSGGAQGYDGQGLTLVKFFFLCTFAAAVPAIVSGGIAERARFLPQCVATALLVGVISLTADVLGPQLSGIAATYPVIMTVVATFTHRQSGVAMVILLLRSLLLSMLSFTAFFLVLGWTIEAHGPVEAFTLATLVSIACSGCILGLLRLRAQRRTE